MVNVTKGDTLFLRDGQRGIVVGSVFKMNSQDRNYYAVPVDIGICVLPVDLRIVVEVWRNGQPVAQQKDLFGEG